MEHPALLSRVDVKLALRKGFPQKCLDACIKSHNLFVWCDSLDNSCKKNVGVLKCVLELVPHRVPRASELAAGIVGLDNDFSRNLSGAKHKKGQTEWGAVGADQLRAMLSYVRRLTRRSRSQCSKSPLLQQLKGLVQLGTGSSSTSLGCPEGGHVEPSAPTTPVAMVSRKHPAADAPCQSASPSAKRKAMYSRGHLLKPHARCLTLFANACNKHVLTCMSTCAIWRPAGPGRYTSVRLRRGHCGTGSR